MGVKIFSDLSRLHCAKLDYSRPWFFKNGNGHAKTVSGQKYMFLYQNDVDRQWREMARPSNFY